MIVLRAHYSGEGNSSRRIGEAERLRDSIHYKNERSMSFSSYLGKVQKMFNIFADQKELYTEDMKLRSIFSTLYHPLLSAAIKALKVSETIGQGGLMITKAAYHLEAQVSVLPEFLAKGGGISAIERGGGNNSIYKADGTIFTGFIKNWDGLSAQDKTKVVDERERPGITSNSPKKGRYRKTSAVEQKKVLASLRKDMKKSQRQLADLKRKRAGGSDNKSVDAADKKPDDAGNSFGGRSEKKKAKSQQA